MVSVQLYCRKNILNGVFQKLQEYGQGALKFKGLSDQPMPRIIIDMKWHFLPITNGIMFECPNNKASIKLANALKNSLETHFPGIGELKIETYEACYSDMQFMPKCIIWLGYQSNPNDMAFIKENQDRIAKALAEGLIKFIKNSGENLKNLLDKELYLQTLLQKFNRQDDLEKTCCLGKVVESLTPGEIILDIIPTKLKTKTFLSKQISFMVATDKRFFHIIKASPDTKPFIEDSYLYDEVPSFRYTSSSIKIGNTVFEFDSHKEDITAFINTIMEKLPTGEIKHPTSRLTVTIAKICLVSLLILIFGLLAKSIVHYLSVPSYYDFTKTHKEKIIGYASLTASDWTWEPKKIGPELGALITGYFYNHTSDYIEEVEVEVKTLHGGRYRDWALCGKVAPYDDGTFRVIIIGSPPTSVRLTGRYKGIREIKEKDYNYIR